MTNDPTNVLVFRCGHLGDMIMSLPAMWAVKHQWPEAKLTLLCDVHPGRQYVLGSDILGRTGMFDSIELYEVPSEEQGWLKTLAQRMRLLVRLWQGGYDALVYLAPSIRNVDQVSRDVHFFKLAGCGRIYGASHFPPVPLKKPGEPFAVGNSEADLLLARLAADGIRVPSKQNGSLDMRLGAEEAAEVARWRATQGTDGGRIWIGVGPGSKMPAKRWPPERFRAVVEALIGSHDVWPVVFGGSEDCEVGETLITAWGRGFNAAGALSVRASCSALSLCALYLGNDTGTMHLAAAAGTPCVALFSARDWPGAWYPYGVEQRVFRKALECEGCYLVECVEHANECLMRITVDEVISGCEDLLRVRQDINVAQAL